MILAAVLLATTGIVTAATVPTFSTANLSNTVKTLSSDAFEGRGPATPAEQRTLEYIEAQFQAAGLQPGGDIKDGKRTWTQAVPLLESRIVGTPTLTLTENGKAMPLTQGKEIAIRSPMDGSKSVDVRDVPWCSWATASARPSATGTTTRASISTARSRWCW